MSSAHTNINIFFDVPPGTVPVTIPEGTVFGDARTTLRWVNMFELTLQAGEFRTITVHADYAGEEYNVPAQTIDRILEPNDLSDLWNEAMLLITHPIPAVGGEGYSRRLEAREREMAALSIDAMIADRSRQQTGIIPSTYTLGIDVAGPQRSVVRGTDYTVVGNADDPIVWTHDMASGTSDAVLSGWRCEIDESGGVARERRVRPARPEPTLREVWAD